MSKGIQCAHPALEPRTPTLPKRSGDRNKQADSRPAGMDPAVKLAQEQWLHVPYFSFCSTMVTGHLHPGAGDRVGSQI